MDIKYKHPVKKRSAESLLEVIVSIFVIALGSAAATGLIINALQTSGLTRDNLLALNLATEGIEAVRNIRDSNWIKYAYDRENCWNMMAEVSECKESNVIKNSSFALTLDTGNMKWKLNWNMGETLDLKTSADPKKFLLSFKDLDTSFDSDLDGILTNDRDIYITDNSLPASKFYRMISVNYPTTANPLIDQEMTVTSLVQWKDRGQVHEIKMVSKLTNYQKVKVK